MTWETSSPERSSSPIRWLCSRAVVSAGASPNRRRNSSSTAVTRSCRPHPAARAHHHVLRTALARAHLHSVRITSAVRPATPAAPAGLGMEVHHDSKADICRYRWLGGVAARGRLGRPRGRAPRPAAADRGRRGPAAADDPAPGRTRRRHRLRRAAQGPGQRPGRRGGARRGRRPRPGGRRRGAGRGARDRPRRGRFGRVDAGRGRPRHGRVHRPGPRLGDPVRLRAGGLPGRGGPGGDDRGAPPGRRRHR